MREVPRYPAGRPGGTPGPDGEHESSPALRRSMYLWWIVGVVVVVLFVVLHLSGVLGPRGH